MEYGKWSDDDWSTLINTIGRGNCILMLGPDASLEEVDGQTRPLTELLANELARTINPEEITAWNIDPSNLVQVSQYYDIKKRKNTLRTKVYDFYYERKDLSSKLYYDLAALPFKLTITTTFDTMFYNALREGKKDPIIARYHLSEPNPDIIKDVTAKKPLVFYLYGTTDEDDSLILSEDDFLKFLVAVVTKNPPPNFICSELSSENKSLLFLGFDFRQWYLRILLHVLKVNRKDSRSFALEQYTLKDKNEFQKIILFYSESDYNIKICNRELQSFITELKTRYDELRERYGDISSASSSIKVSTILFQDTPTVFLCHSKEHRDSVEYLRDQLREAGFNAWFDEDDVRGGDEWDRKIKRAIEKEIDYFVVLQSNVMTKKPESYFNKEIRLALERQNKFRPGLRFIIPSKIEECPLLEQLEHLQTIDLSNKENVEKLISTIKRDQERRKRG